MFEALTIKTLKENNILSRACYVTPFLIRVTLNELLILAFFLCEINIYLKNSLMVLGAVLKRIDKML